MLQDPNVERYIEIAVKPLKKEIEQMKAQIEVLNQALRIHDVNVSVCDHKEALEKGYPLCNKCSKWLV